MSDIAISVSHVSKTFKIPHEKISSLRGAVTGAFKKGGFEEFKALDDVSFEVHPVKSAKSGAKQFNGVNKGEFFGIIGRNGSGKSTLLKILAGIYMKENFIKKIIKSVGGQILMVFFQVLTVVSEYANIEIAKTPAPILG